MLPKNNDNKFISCFSMIKLQNRKTIKACLYEQCDLPQTASMQM